MKSSPIGTHNISLLCNADGLVLVADQLETISENVLFSETLSSWVFESHGLV